MKRIIDYDPLTGVSTWFEYHPETDMTVVATMQDAATLLDQNKALANDTDRTSKGIQKGWWQYASIPNIVIEKWRNEHGIDLFKKEHWNAVFKKLNDPEYRYLKTTAKWHW